MPSAPGAPSTTETGVDDALSPDQRYMATPFQFGLLSVASLGVYGFYWLFKLRRVVDDASGKPIAPWYWWLGLLVPFLNLFLYFGLLNDLEVKVASSGRRPPTLWLVGLCAGLLNLTWRLPGAWALITILSFIPLMIVQANALAWQRHLYTAPSRAHRFRWWEWLIIVIGGIFQILVLLGSLVPHEGSTPADPWVVGGLAGITLATLLWTGIAGENWGRPHVDERARSESEAVESNVLAPVGSLPPHDP